MQHWGEVGDQNGDGAVDLLAGAPLDSATGFDSGTVFVVSGKDGSLLRTIHGEESLSRCGVSVAAYSEFNGDGLRDVLVGFIDGAQVVSGGRGKRLASYLSESDSDYGHSLASVGDLDADGVEEVAVGLGSNHPKSHNSGVVSIFSGKDGSVLREHIGFDGDAFGASLSALGDHDRDGIPDYAVGAPSIQRRGHAYIYSGRDGSVLLTVSGSQAYDRFGESISGAGDMNRDGIPDLLVGAPSHQSGKSGVGRAAVVSGRDGSLIHEFIGTENNEHLGTSVAGIGDVNGDGVDDGVVGVPGATRKGASFVFSGFDGSLLFTLANDMNSVGSAVACAGDANGDGTNDILITSLPGNTVFLFSGATGSLLFIFRRSGLFGIALAGAGDVNGDGWADAVIGASYDNGQGYGTGAAYLFLGNDLYLAAEPESPFPGSTLSFHTRGGAAQKPVALFLVAVNGRPFVTLIDVGTLDQAGNWSIAKIVPPGLTGLELEFRSFALNQFSRIADSSNASVAFR